MWKNIDKHFDADLNRLCVNVIIKLTNKMSENAKMQKIVRVVSG